MIEKLKSDIEAATLFPRAIASLAKRAVSRVVLGPVERADTKLADQCNDPRDEIL